MSHRMFTGYRPNAVLSSAAPTPGSSWVRTKRPCSGFGGRSAAKPSPRTCRETSLSSSGGSPKTSTGIGLNATPAKRSWTSRSGSASAGPLSRGHSRRPGRKQPGAVFEAKFMLPLELLRGGRGRKVYAAAAAQHVGHQCQGGGAFDYHRWRQMGGNHPLRRPALPAPAADGGKEVLAVC